jgi:DNA-binding transcriptional LysR family regulator
MLPCTLPVFRKEYPHIQVIVHEANSDVLEEMILTGEVDLAFFTLPIHSSEITHEVIKLEEILLVLPPDHRLADAGILKPDCRYPWVDIRLFERESFILQKRDQRTRHIGDDLFAKAGFEPNVALYVRNILASVQLVMNGFGVMLASESHLRHIHTDIKPVCFSVGTPYTSTKFVAAYRRGTYLPGFARRYIEIVREFT